MRKHMVSWEKDLQMAAVPHLYLQKGIFCEIQAGTCAGKSEMILSAWTHPIVGDPPVEKTKVPW